MSPITTSPSFRRLALTLATAAIGLGGAAEAQASTVRAFGDSLTYFADAGEANKLSISPAAGNNPARVWVTDPNAIVAARGKCTFVNAHRALCPAPRNVNIALHDLSDTAAVRLATNTVASDRHVLLQGGSGNDEFIRNGLQADRFVGGPGRDTMSYLDRVDRVTMSANDYAGDGVTDEKDNIAPDVEVLNGGKGPDYLSASFAVDSSLRGEGGDDSIFGRTRNDVLNGGAGNDTLNGGEGKDSVLASVGADQANGGPGEDTLYGNDLADPLTGITGGDTFAGGEDTDTVDYLGRTSAQAINLDGTATSGFSAEKDRINTDVENARGGSGPDAILGSAVANVLDGADGDDAIRARDGVADTVACGNGTDSLEADPLDTQTACETVSLPADPAAPAAPAEPLTPATAAPRAAGPRVAIGPRKVRIGRKGKIALRVRCPRTAKATCTGAVVLQRKAGRRMRTIARGRFAARPGRTTVVRLKVRRAAKVRATATTRAGDSASARSSRSIKVLAKRR